MTLFRRILALLTLAVIVLAATRQLDWEWGALLERLRDASLPLLALALVANLASIVTRAWLWWLFLRSTGAPMFSLAFRGTIIGLALNGVLIGRAGEAARVLIIVNGSAVDGPAATATVLAERAAMIGGYALIAFASSAFIPVPDAVSRTLRVAPVVIVAIATLLGGGIALGRFLARRRSHVVDGLPPHGAVGLATRVAARAAELITVVRAPPVACTLLVAAAWALQLATYHLTALALRFPTPLSASLAALVLVNAGTTVGITPGNMGVVQAAYAASMQMSGLPLNVAVDVAVVLQAIQTVPVLLLWLAMVVARFTCPTASRQVALWSRSRAVCGRKRGSRVVNTFDDPGGCGHGERASGALDSTASTLAARGWGAFAEAVCRYAVFPRPGRRKAP